MAEQHGGTGQFTEPSAFLPASLVVIFVTAHLSNPEFAGAWGEWQTEEIDIPGFLGFSR